MADTLGDFVRAITGRAPPRLDVDHRGRYRWQATAGACPRCRALDGHYEGDGWRQDLPPGAGGPPPLHTNCECIIVDAADAITPREWARLIKGG